MDLTSLFRYFITKEKLVFSLYLWDFTSYLPQHCLYFLPLPHVRPSLVYIVLCDIYSIIRFPRYYKVWDDLVYIVHIVL